MDAMLARLTGEREQKAALIKNYATEAEAHGRDLTESELQTIGDARERVAAIDTQIAALAGDLEMADETKERLAKIDPVVRAEMADHYRGDAGRYLYDVIHGAAGEAESRDRLARFRRSMERGGESHFGHDKDWTNPDDHAGDFKALYVTPDAALIRPNFQGSPTLDALGVANLPGYEFRVPYLALPTAIGADGAATTDLRQGSGYTTTKNVAGNADTDPLADATGGGASPGVAKTPVPQMVLDVAGEMVTATNYGIAFNVDRDRLLSYQPEALGILLDSARLLLARQLESAALATIGGSTGKVTLAASADGPTTLKAIADAAVKVMETTYMPPTTLIVGPKGAGMLMAAADLAGRPLLPTVAPSNASGTSNLATFTIPTVGGINVAVTHAITDTAMWLVNGETQSFWGRSGDILTTVEAVLRGQTWSLGYLFGGIRPKSYENGAVKIAP